MTGFESYIAILFGFMIVTTSPDPANIAIASVSMSKGQRSGFAFALGPSQSAAVHWAPTNYKITNWSVYIDALNRRGSLALWFDPEMVWGPAVRRIGAILASPTVPL